MKIIIQILLMLFPQSIRRFFYKSLFGFKIHKTAKIGFSLILCKEFEMEENTRIGHLTIIKPIDKVYMGKYARIGALNFITGFNTSSNGYAKKVGFYRHVLDRKCELILDEDVAISSRHIIDCNGGVYFGAHSSLAGMRSQILTHGIDAYNCRQDAKPVKIGKYVSIGSGSIVLKGTEVPDYVIVGAGAVLNKKYTESYKVYGGVPAKVKKDLSNEDVKWFSRGSGDVI